MGSITFIGSGIDKYYNTFGEKVKNSVKIKRKRKKINPTKKKNAKNNNRNKE